LIFIITFTNYKLQIQITITNYKLQIDLFHYMVASITEASILKIRVTYFIYEFFI